MWSSGAGVMRPSLGICILLSHILCSNITINTNIIFIALNLFHRIAYLVR